MKELMTTAFWTALASYVIFAFVDFWRPGFVSYNFSVHWFLAVAIISGVLSVMLPSSSRFKPADRRFAPTAFAIFIGLLLSMMVWRAGEPFGDWRIFLSLAALFGPVVMLRLLKPDVA